MSAVREHRVVRPLRLAHSRGTILYEARCPCCRALFGGREDDLSRACPQCETPVEVEIGDRDLSAGIASSSYLAIDWARR